MIFRPKLLDTLKTYNREQFSKDLMAGFVVGIVALPLAIAFAIASGVSPEKGLFTAIIAGFLISALGGSRVQIGGPTGAFIVVVYGIIQVYGINGLIIATFMAGILLILLGLARLGTVIQFIPYPLIVGFTSGIALIILSSQVKDFFGLAIPVLPADFAGQWQTYVTAFRGINVYAVLTAVATLLIVISWPRISRKIPGSLVAIILTTTVVQWLHLPVETIGTKFGAISSALPAPALPRLDFATIKNLVQPAVTIALLGGIESLLSAVVADGMTGGKHRSNTELIAQGTANIFSALLGGIPATGAIARTATNIKNGGRTPVAGIVHVLVLLVILLFVGQWAALIPMATLAGILVVVAYNMSEWKNFVSLLKGPRGDVAVLLITFLLTVLVDITVAIEVGMLLAVLLFMRSMIKFSDVSAVHPFMASTSSPASFATDTELPGGVTVFEITGPLFFGAAYKFKEAMRLVERPPRVLILRMRQVPVIDATGIKTIADMHKEVKQRGTRLILSEVYSEQVLQELRTARLLFAIGKANVTSSFEKAVERSKVLAGDVL